MALTVWRGGRESVVNEIAEAEPELSESDLTLIWGRSRRTGAVVADLNASLADRMRIRGADKGAVIVDIEPQSPAERVGFQKGDVVLGAQGEDVTTAEQLVKLVEADSRLWRIKFSRDGRVSNVVIGG